MTEPKEFSEKDLKIQALLERISNLTATYENQVADLRVALTVSEQVREQQEEILNVLEETEEVTEDNPED